MTRVKGGTVARNRRKKVLKAAKGYFGSKHRIFKTAHEQVMHSGVYAFRDRKQNKRNFRKLWIVRINAACRENEISYSKFINGLTKAGLVINRKMLSEVAIDSPATFTDLINIAKDALEGKEYKPKAVVIETEAKTAKKVKAEVETTEEVEVKATVKKAAPKKAGSVEKKPAAKKAAPKATVKKVTKKAE